MALYKGKKTRRTPRKRSMYSSNYKYKKSSVIWKRVLAVVVCIALFAVGLFVLGPILEKAVNFFKDDVSSTGNSSPMADDGPSSAPDDSSAPGVSSDDKQPQGDGAKLTYMLTADIFTDAQQLSAALDRAASEGADVIMLELKGYDGKLNYVSRLERVNAVSAVSENAVELGEIIDLIKSRGFKCGASVTVFDECYTAANLRDTAIKYNGSATTRWLDYTRTPPSAWQDPGLEPAVEYELNIIRELSGYDLAVISLNGCHYPVWGNLNGCDYDKTRTKVENISDFISAARTVTNSAGILLDVTVSADAAVGDMHSRYENYGYPDNVFTFDCDSVTVDLRLDGIITDRYPEITVGGIGYSDLTSDRAASLLMLYKAAAERSGGCSMTVLTDEQGLSAREASELLSEAGAESIVCLLSK